MGKLRMSENSGWNAGKNYYARELGVHDVVIDSEISKVFVYDEKMLNEITRSIKERGYDKSQPIVVWKDMNVVLDGHTRLAAAKAAGLLEIPVVEKEFEDKSDAIFYTFERQVIRRNLTSDEILSAVEIMCMKSGRGNASELARRLGVSRMLLHEAKTILREAPKEEVAAVRSGEKSIKEVYRELPSVKQRKESAAAESAVAVKEIENEISQARVEEVHAKRSEAETRIDALPVEIKSRCNLIKKQTDNVLAALSNGDKEETLRCLEDIIKFADELKESVQRWIK